MRVLPVGVVGPVNTSGNNACALVTTAKPTFIRQSPVAKPSSAQIVAACAPNESPPTALTLRCTMGFTAGAPNASLVVWIASAAAFSAAVNVACAALSAASAAVTLAAAA